MADVFVSYKAEDRQRVAPLVRALESDGFSVWWDAHIGAGDDWRETILRHLEAAKCVIVIWSRRSIGPQGQFVRDEASRAVRRRSYLPIRIDRVDPPLGFGETQAHDLVGWKGDALDVRYQEVLGNLRERFGINARGHKVPISDKSWPSRRMVVAGGAAAIVGAGGVGTWLTLRASSSRADSIAVLPFENLSGDPSQAYFSDGIAEELRSALARIPGLKVVARTSSEAVRNADAQTAAAKLHVADILTGSVRRSPQLLRISAQLVDGREGTERWSEVYDRPIGDSLQIQSEIANRVAEALRIRIGARNQDARALGGTNNPQAQDLLLRANASTQNDDSEAAVRKSLDFADAALLVDPKYADAMVVKADCLGKLGSYFSQNPADARLQMDQAIQLGRTAIEIAPLSGRAHSALAMHYFWTFEFRSALQEFEKVQSLGSQSGADFGSISWCLAMLGRFESASMLANRAIAIDPLNAQTYLNRASALLLANRLRDAELSVKQAIQLGGNLREPHGLYADILIRAGRLAEAQQQLAKGFSDHTLPQRAIIAERLGDRNKSSELLQELVNSSAAATEHYQIAEVYAQQHQTDEAMSELDKAWSARDSGLAEALTDYLLDPIRSDPRFQSFLKKLNFPD